MLEDEHTSGTLGVFGVGGDLVDGLLEETVLGEGVRDAWKSGFQQQLIYRVVKVGACDDCARFGRPGAFQVVYGAGVRLCGPPSPVAPR